MRVRAQQKPSALVSDHHPQARRNFQRPRGISALRQHYKCVCHIVCVRVCVRVCGHRVMLLYDRECACPARISVALVDNVCAVVAGAGKLVQSRFARSPAAARLYSNDTVMIVAIGDRRANTIWDLHIAHSRVSSRQHQDARARVLRISRVRLARCCRSVHLRPSALPAPPPTLAYL